jgi:hypothetical protein
MPPSFLGTTYFVLYELVQGSTRLERRFWTVVFVFLSPRSVPDATVTMRALTLLKGNALE